MAEEEMEHKPFDEFSDQFTITFNPYGANLSFAVSDSSMPKTGQKPPSRHLGTIRMNTENLKVMTMITWRQILNIERSTGVKIDIPREVRDRFQISQEDWDALWKRS